MTRVREYVKVFDEVQASLRALKKFTFEKGYTYLVSHKRMDGQWVHCAVFPGYDEGMRELIKTWERQ